MNSSKRSSKTVKLILVTFLTMLVSGCLGLGEEVAAPYQAPPLDARDEKMCYDPGIKGDSISALGDTRTALADCRRKHKNVVNQYRSVRVELGKAE